MFNLLDRGLYLSVLGFVAGWIFAINYNLFVHKLICLVYIIFLLSFAL
jgi:hypothetical protein